MHRQFQNNGYCAIERFIDDRQLVAIRNAVERFHKNWISEHQDFYDTQAINSAYLTGSHYLNASDRACLFQVMGSSKLMAVVKTLIPDRPCFMNTQLFFDPVNPKQNNYWHRDTQYHMSIAEQQAALNGPQVIHFRIPLKNERGLELVPGSHKNWDNEEELEVRLQQSGRKNYEPLATGKEVALNAGDLLVFSANMIHRGLYGMDRLALDILYCDPDPNLIKFVEADCLPDAELMKGLQDSSAFVNAIDAKGQFT